MQKHTASYKLSSESITTALLPLRGTLKGSAYATMMLCDVLCDSDCTEYGVQQWRMWTTLEQVVGLRSDKAP